MSSGVWSSLKIRKSKRNNLVALTVSRLQVTDEGRLQTKSTLFHLGLICILSYFQGYDFCPAISFMQALKSVVARIKLQIYQILVFRSETHLIV